MTHAHETDEAALAAAAAMRMSLIVARRAAHRMVLRVRAGTTAAGAAAQEARQTAVLADSWRREALAARWAAADVTRDQDPVAAAAWDERVRDAGIDPDEVRTTALATAEAESVVAEPDPVMTEAQVRDRWFRRGMVAPPSSPPVLGVDPASQAAEQVVDVRTPAEPALPQAFPAVIGADGPEQSGAGDLVTEYLAETYTQDAVDRGGPPDPGPEPTIGELIAATEPPSGALGATPNLTTDHLGVAPTLALGVEQTRDEGIER